MKDKIDEINSVAGVKTSFLYFNDGELVYQTLPPGLDADNLTEIAKDFVQMAAISDRLQTGNNEYDIKYDSGRILAFTQHNYNLIVLCEANVSLAMLRLTINVAIADLEADKKFQKRSAKVETTRRSFLVRSNMDTESWNLVETVN
jgi:predicted regulator of Ras-like GTPase activity (Roadblock/LC7/MglB family)